MRPNIKRIRELIHHLRTKRIHRVFDFRVISSNAHKGKNGTPTEYMSPPTGCGTHGCAMGEFPALWPRMFMWKGGKLALDMPQPVTELDLFKAERRYLSTVLTHMRKEESSVERAHSDGDDIRPATIVSLWLGIPSPVVSLLLYPYDTETDKKTYAKTKHTIMAQLGTTGDSNKARKIISRFRRLTGGATVATVTKQLEMFCDEWQRCKLPEMTPEMEKITEAH